MQAAAASPPLSEAQVLFPEYSSFDAEGLPDRGAEGAEVSGSKRKSCKKELDRYRKEHVDFLAKGGPEYYRRVRSEMDELAAAIKSIGV